MGSPVVPLRSTSKMNFKFFLAVFVVAVALMPTAHSQWPNRQTTLRLKELQERLKLGQRNTTKTSTVTAAPTTEGGICQCQLYNTDLPTYDFTVYGGVASYFDCGQHCLSDANCKSFTWYSSTRKCHLKWGLPNTKTVIGAFSARASCFKNNS